MIFQNVMICKIATNCAIKKSSYGDWHQNNEKRLHYSENYFSLCKNLSTTAVLLSLTMLFHPFSHLHDIIT